MNISKKWLQTFFDAPLPATDVITEALTFHAFEIDGVEQVNGDDILDVKITPNRGHDCLSHRGVAKEISAILKLPMKTDPFTSTPDLSPKTAEVSVTIEDAKLCPRYTAGVIHGVKVAPSPEWLRECLEAIGQRSINNVVDATNYVMFHIGQPLHAFDAAKLTKKDSGYAIAVRKARAGESIAALDGKDYVLDDSVLVIADAHADVPIGIAGIKGGVPSAIGEETKDIIIESANFAGPLIRKAGQKLKFRTDATQRFEQVISPELAGFGMRAVVELITELAGGTIEGFVDIYPNPQKPSTVSVTLAQAQRVLGDTFGDKEIKDAFDRLGFVYTTQGDTYTVNVPFERLDLEIAEDLCEEIGRVIGYDHVPSVELPPAAKAPEVNVTYYASEKLREEFVAQGYSEVFTSVFVDSGERVIANKVDGVRPYLRTSLVAGLQEALEKNKRNKDFLGLKEIKLFEIGAVWKAGKEIVMVGSVTEKQKATEKPLADSVPKETPTQYDTLPLSTAAQYQSYSKYPFIVRDIALWTPTGTKPEDVLAIITPAAEDLPATAGLLVRKFHIDTYEKGEKVSLAFRLIFQSFEKTLTDEEVADVMAHIVTVVTEKGWEVR